MRTVAVVSGTNISVDMTIILNFCSFITMHPFGSDDGLLAPEAPQLLAVTVLSKYYKNNLIILLILLYRKVGVEKTATQNGLSFYKLQHFRNILYRFNSI
ncbi:hypothetical protein BpHYR1_002608 [Brachionus plicatilis]|uniref:Uncharacterized protein n=1 Tax=Brachionus plicatilis TaxID=10195 RepID=A0A3M7S106_BRAPC|nr:hypothetical protein BpHYR1_002608 [Brachionus plicatilis]